MKIGTKRDAAKAAITMLVVFIVLMCSGYGEQVAKTFCYLVGGWATFIERVGPQIHVRWDLVASAAVYATILVVGSQLFLRWLYREMSGNGTWRWRWTLSGFALVVLMFTSGLAAIGIVHQTAWLAT